MDPRRLALLFASALVSACSSTPTAPTGAFCARLAEYARSIEGEPRSITLGRGGAWMVNHYKFCKRADDDKAGIEFCDWLMGHTSTEFMEANINTALSCLQRQEIKGYIGNTGIQFWVGRAVFFAPRIDVEDVKIEIEYSVQYFESEDQEDFIKISVLPD